MSWKNIRKDSGDITIEDLREFPSWQYCLDEGHIEGQTECTMRPLKHRDATLSLGEHCMVACRFTLPAGIEHFGWIELGPNEFGLELDNYWSLNPEIFLDPTVPVPKRSLDITQFDLVVPSVFAGASTRINFCLPPTRVVDDKLAETLAKNVAKTLGTNLDNLFPIMLEPLHQIRGRLGEYALTRFYRPPDDGEPYRRFGEIDAPDCPKCGKQLRTKLAKQCIECGHDWH